MIKAVIEENTRKRNNPQGEIKGLTGMLRRRNYSAPWLGGRKGTKVKTRIKMRMGVVQQQEVRSRLHVQGSGCMIGVSGFGEGSVEE